MTTSSRKHVRRLAVARFISSTGSSAAYTALMFAVYDRTHSPKWLAMTLLLTWGVSGFVGPFAGALGDRFDRQKVMIGSDLSGAVLFLALVLVSTPLSMVLVASAAGLAETPFWAASGAAIPALAGEEHLSWANGLLATGRNGALMFGPVIGGALVASVGPHWVFVINAVSFFISAGLVSTVRGRFADEDREHVKGLTEGVRFLSGERILRTIMLAWMILVLGMGMGMVADLPLVHGFGAGAVGYGVLIACWGGGSVVGSVSGRFLDEGREFLAIILGTLAVGVTTGLVWTSPWLVMAVVLIFFSGVADALTMVAQQGIWQRRTPDAVRSRVMAATEAVWQISFAVAFMVGGVAVEALGPKRVYGLAGVAAIVASVGLLPILRGVKAGRTESGVGR